jgi:hypothetical protein
MAKNVFLTSILVAILATLAAIVDVYILHKCFCELVNVSIDFFVTITLEIDTKISNLRKTRPNK